VLLDATAVEKFSRFSGLLDQWSAKTNLIACRSAAELVDRHLLDSLALVSLIPPGSTVADLGSGAGFPGIPLAIVRLDCRVLLVESRRRRCTFLRAVKRHLELEMTVLEGRAEAACEDHQVPPADVAMCRAVWSDETLLPIAASWLRPGGILLWMRSELGDSDRGSTAPEAAGQMAMLWERRHRYGMRGRIGNVEIYRHQE
jgi:16S rRNA (guanine527-N7)-methyltransferase